MSQSQDMVVVSHISAWSGSPPSSWPWPPHSSSLFPSTLPLLLPAKEPPSYTPDGGLLRLFCGPPLLLAAAPSLLEDERPAPARASLDQATPPGPLQPLHHPHGGQYPSGDQGQGLRWFFIGVVLCADVVASSFLGSAMAQLRLLVWDHAA